MAEKKRNRVVRIAPRKRPLHSKTIASLSEIVEETKTGGVSAVVCIATRPGFGVWIVRSAMTSRERMNLIGQIEYLKWLMLHDEENDGQ